MSNQKPVEWVSALMTRFEEQLPCRNGPQTHHTRINVQQNKESLIHISKWKFSLVISGLTRILTKINEMRSSQLPEFERDYYESLLIVLDTLEKCLTSQAQAAAAVAAADPAPEQPVTTSTTGSTMPKYDDVMNVKLLLKEICQFLDMPTSSTTSTTSTLTGIVDQQQSSSSQVNQIRQLASNVLFALSRNNFSAVFSRISGRLQELSVSPDESADHTDIELIQHIDVDLPRSVPK